MWRGGEGKEGTDKGQGRGRWWKGVGGVTAGRDGDWERSEGWRDGGTEGKRESFHPALRRCLI